jgi:hypothetical protein
VKRIDFIVNAGRWAFDMEPRYTLGLLVAQRLAGAGELLVSGPSSSEADFIGRAVKPVPVQQGQLEAWTTTADGPTWEVPLLPDRRFAAVFTRLREGARFDSGGFGWTAFPIQGDFNETSHKRFFRHESGVPVWKGRSFDRFDPHGFDPAGFAEETEALEFVQGRRSGSRSVFRGRFPPEVLADPSTHPYFSARIAFRDVTNRTNSRTVLACLVPPRTFLTNSAPYLVFDLGGAREQAFVLGVLNSLPFDWQARRYAETHMNFYVLGLLCLPDPDRADVGSIAERAARLSAVDDRFATFAEAVGVACGPLLTEERLVLEAEIDALVADAYDLSEADLEVVFSDFTQAAVPAEQRDRIGRTRQEL